MPSRQRLSHAELALDADRLRVLKYIPATVKTVLALRSCSSGWRSSVERSREWQTEDGDADAKPGEGPTTSTMKRSLKLSRNGKSALVLLHGDPNVSLRAEVKRPVRTISIHPRVYPHVSEQQLYRIFHVIDTITRARPAVTVQVSVDYRDWFPRKDPAAPALAAAGFTDADTVASITPQHIVAVALGASTPLPCTALGSMLVGSYQLAHIHVEQWCDDAALTVIGKSAPNLTTLVIQRAPKVSDAALQFAATFLTNLHTLQLCECPQVTDRGLSAMVRGSSNALRKVQFPFCERMTDLTMTQIAASCGRNLQVLDVSGNRLVTPEGILMLFTEQCKLEALHANFAPGVVDRDVLEAIVEYGWTVQTVSGAFSEIDRQRGAAELVQKLRSRGCDVMC